MSDFERFGKPHPFLPSGWGPQARSDIPWNAPILADINPASAIISRLNSRFGEDGSKGRASGYSEDDDPSNGILGADGFVGGNAGLSGAGNAAIRNQIASLRNMLSQNGISSEAFKAGTSLMQRMENLTGEGVCNGDGTITLTITIPP